MASSASWNARRTRAVSVVLLAASLHTNDLHSAGRSAPELGAHAVAPHRAIAVERHARVQVVDEVQALAERRDVPDPALERRRRAIAVLSGGDRVWTVGQVVKRECQ